MTPRAVVFDLDDTLYRERRFALSGYSAVAALVEQQFGVRRRQAFATLARTLRRGQRAQAFQRLCERYRLPACCIPAWVDAYRRHAPHLRLSRDTVEVLGALRGSWRTAILTNGLPSVQAAKVRALGLGGLVDLVLFAGEFGGGKPSPAPFLEVLEQLDVDPLATVFVGNDPVRDIAGARRVGLRTILIDRVGPGNLRADAGADRVVQSIRQVPTAAASLVEVAGEVGGPVAVGGG
jgi:putative hydrolase of the HAD superfamily